MMARRRKRSKKWISWLIILILVIAAGVVVYLVWDNYFNDDKGRSEEQQTEIVDKNADNESEQKETEQVEVKKEEVVQYEGENPNTAAELTGVVTYAGLVGDKLTIRVNINQYLSGGSCALRLVFEDDVNVYSETVNIVNSASTSTCEGFDVPRTGLAGGKYSIIINLDSDGKTGVINGEVNL